MVTLKYNIMFMGRFKSTYLHKYGICLNKYPESVQICHLLYKSVQNMTFNCTMNQNVSKHKIELNMRA